MRVCVAEYLRGTGPAVRSRLACAHRDKRGHRLRPGWSWDAGLQWSPRLRSSVRERRRRSRRPKHSGTWRVETSLQTQHYWDLASPTRRATLCSRGECDGHSRTYAGVLAQCTARDTPHPSDNRSAVGACLGRFDVAGSHRMLVLLSIAGPASYLPT